jgi:hypothetical protein
MMDSMIDGSLADLLLMDVEFGLTSESGRPNPQMAETCERAQVVFDAERIALASTPMKVNQRPWPIHPSVTVLDAVAEPILRQWVTRVVECLQLVVWCYSSDAQVQEALAVPPLLHRWILEHPAPQRLRVDFCRLDLLGDTLGTVKVLEFNASSPGAALSFGMLNRIWRESHPGDGVAAGGIPVPQLSLLLGRQLRPAAAGGRRPAELASDAGDGHALAVRIRTKNSAKRARMLKNILPIGLVGS